MADRKPGINFPPMHPYCRCSFTVVIPDNFVEKYEQNHGKMPDKIVDKSGESGIMKSGIKIDMQFFAEKDIERQESNSLKRAIRNYNKRIKEHEEYIKNPYEHCHEWDNYEERKKNGLIRHWKKEISNFEKSIEDRIKELKKRGDYYE
ncbi:MAG: hypothetical protein ACI4RN_00760 [Oscillospiraceae bacterium]